MSDVIYGVVFGISEIEVKDKGEGGSGVCLTRYERKFGEDKTSLDVQEEGDIHNSTELPNIMSTLMDNLE